MGIAFLHLISDIELEHISFVPLAVTLTLDQLDNLLLFGLDASLFFFESIKLGMPLSYLFSLLAGIDDPSIWIFIPDIQNRDADIPAKIVKSLLRKENYLIFVIIWLNIVHRISFVF